MLGFRDNGLSSGFADEFVNLREQGGVEVRHLDGEGQQVWCSGYQAGIGFLGATRWLMRKRGTNECRRARLSVIRYEVVAGVERFTRFFMNEPRRWCMVRFHRV